jgi:hypothetical protein
MPKVIGTDNHARDHISDRVHIEGVTEEQGKLICEELNRGLGDGPGYYYQVKPDDYKPYVFEGW